MEAAERAGAMVTEQIRGITEAAEHRADDLRREAEADAESLDRDGRDAARGILERIDRLETAVQQLIGSLRHEADALSRLVHRGQSARSDRPSRSARAREPLALQSGSASASAEAPPVDAVPAPAPGDGDSVISTEPSEWTEGAPTLDGRDETGGEVAVDHEGPVVPEPEAGPLERESELPILADPEPEVVSEPEQSATSDPLDAAEVSPLAEPPEAEVVVASGDAFEGQGPEHAPTIDHPEPALEDEQLSDLEETEPYSEVEEPLADEPCSEAGEAPLETLLPEAPEPRAGAEPEAPEPLSEVSTGVDPYSEEDVELSEAGSPLEEEQFPDSDLEPPPDEELVEAGPIEEPEPGSTEDPYAESEDDLEVDSRPDAAPGEEAGGIDDTSAPPGTPRRRGLRSLFRRRSASPESPDDEQGSRDLERSQDVQRSEGAFEAVEDSAESVSGDPLGSGIEGPPPADDEFSDSPPIVVQEGWWEQKASEEETPTGDPPADAETDVGNGTDAAREDPTAQPVVGPHEDALDAPHRGGESLEEALEKEALSDPSQNERDANVGISLGDIQPSGPAASAETLQCVVCNRVQEGSFEAAEAEGWYVAGAEAICERCQATGWRLQEASDQPERRSRFFGRAGGSL